MLGTPSHSEKSSPSTLEVQGATSAAPSGNYSVLNTVLTQRADRRHRNKTDRRKTFYKRTSSLMINSLEEWSLAASFLTWSLVRIWIQKGCNLNIEAQSTRLRQAHSRGYSTQNSFSRTRLTLSRSVKAITMNLSMNLSRVSVRLRSAATLCKAS